MSGPALALLIAAAFAHAGWNLLAKRAGAGGSPFVWASAATGVVLWAPLGIGALLLGGEPFGAIAAGLAAVSGVLHSIYFIALQRGYRDGDLSVVYPIARALGPLLAVPVAAVTLGQRPGPAAVVGGLVIVAAVLSLTGRPRPGDRASLAYATLTGLCIAAYTVWDAFTVDRVALSPITLFWAAELSRCLWLAPIAIHRRSAVVEVLREHRRLVVGVAILSPLAYILVLQALRLAPVSVVAPTREMSIVIGALLGTRLLGEPGGRRRVIAAATVVLGIALLAW
ncbi:MAG TPA: EamA family transporter [Euzebyales bacterium]|nr:EamA family transporter [Euzebyales bacterium]